MVINKYLAEFLGTFILVFFGSLAILGTLATEGPLLITVGLGFGMALLAGIWAVGHVSGAHFNPAVTLAMLLDGRTTFGDAIGYWVSQFAGAGVASLVVWAASDRVSVAATTTTYSRALDRNPGRDRPDCGLRLGDPLRDRSREPTMLPWRSP